MRSNVAVRLSLVGALLASLFVAAGAATAGPSAAATKFSASGSARQVYATGIKPGARTELLNSAGHVVATKTSNEFGGTLYYNVKPGSDYHLKVLPNGPTSSAITVHTNATKPWDPKIYNQSVPDSGYGYLTTRDGTQLAYTVHPPTSPAGEPGLPFTPPSGLPDYAPPYPTLIEYAGYGYANPAGPESGIAVLANLMGFAVVDIEMRGMGCSGGAFNFFEPLQNLDGYDIIETIARQPWVKGHKVGMLGISYGGISQLFTAQLNPPHLAAIAPLSVIDATATTLYPGGILNTGFAVAWADERQYSAKPAGPHGGQAWAYDRIKNGDNVCKANQALRPEAQDLRKTIAANSHYKANVADALDPVTFVHKIHVPVFMACQWEDEQTGGHCATLAAHMTGTTKKWFTFTNGAHIDSLDPETYNRWYDFLELYVADQAPMENAAVTQAAAPVIYQAAMGLPQDDAVTLPVDPIQSMPTYDMAKAAFDALPQVRVLFDNGAGTSPKGDQTPGNPYPQFEASFAKWPIPNTAAKRFYLGTKGMLTDGKPSTSGVDWYTSDAHALTKTDFGTNTGGGGLWGNASQWDWKWKSNPAGTAVSYISSPLKQNTVVIGSGAVYVWVKSSTPDVDLQATISEVTPDGHETFVQNGYIRASERKMSTTRNNILHTPSTLLEPVPSMLTSDARPMPKNKFVRVAIPLYYEGHAYRAGTRIRVTIAAPNGAQPIWAFNYTEPSGTAEVSIAHSPSMPSMLVLPIVSGVSVSAAQPPCPSLRNEPCRTYTPLVNRTATGG